MKHLKPLAVLLLVLGGGILINAVIASMLSNLSTGIWMTWLLGLLLIALGLSANRLPSWVIPTALGLLCIVILAVSTLFLSGHADTATYTEDVVLVLGAGIQGDQPTESLQNRLDQAVAYHRQNPDARIVVSGGQGPQESVTEAYAMEQYLIRQGVDAAYILKEERATATSENFRFTKALLDERMDKPYTICFITTDYHIYRAAAYAKLNGFSQATHIHSATPWYMVLPNGMRECLAVAKLVLSL